MIKSFHVFRLLAFLVLGLMASPHRHTDPNVYTNICRRPETIWKTSCWQLGDRAKLQQIIEIEIPTSVQVQN